MTLIQVTNAGEEHGLVNSFPNSVPDNDFKNFEPSKKEELRKKRKDDARLVKCKYINHEEGELGRLSQPYCKYAGDPIHQYHLIHGYEYTLPKGFIDEVNSLSKPIRSGLQSVDGKDVQKDGSPLAKDKKTKVHEIFPVGF